MKPDTLDNTKFLRVLSIFPTFDGEANAFHVGTPSVFIRLSGCSVGCSWCDTKYSWSFKRGRDMTARQILEHVNSFADGVNKVTITGGEPLEQMGDAFMSLLFSLVNAGEKRYRVTIETAGTISWRRIYETHKYEPKVHMVLDFKQPSAFLKGEKVYTPFLEDMECTKEGDVIKYVIGDSTEFNEAVKTLDTLIVRRNFKGRVVFSPVHNQLEPSLLAAWMAGSPECRRYQVGMNLQTHKYIWPENVLFETTLGLDFSKEVIRE